MLYDIAPDGSFYGAGRTQNSDTMSHLAQKYFKRFLQLAAWGAIVTIAVLSLVPGELRPHTGAAGYLEHVAAYVITAMLLSLVYYRCSRIVIVAPLSLYAASLEFAQLYVSGRSASVLDWIAGSLGSLIGAAIATLILRLWLQLPEAIVTGPNLRDP